MNLTEWVWTVIAAWVSLLVIGYAWIRVKTDAEEDDDEQGGSHDVAAFRSTRES
jgi:hypothetical protein